MADHWRSKFDEVRRYLESDAWLGPAIALVFAIAVIILALVIR
jgi:hypothetical protein